jgi:hypothetical protein
LILLSRLARSLVWFRGNRPLVPCLHILSLRIWLRARAGTEVTPARLLAERRAVATLRPTVHRVPL